MIFVYGPDTGKIDFAIGGQPMELALATNVPLGMSALESDEVSPLDRYYVKDGAIAERPTFTPTITPTSTPADGASVVTISGFPVESTLTISGPINESWTETQTSTELTVNLPGLYKVRIENWPHQDAEVTFHAT